jgi:hypothetical protein
VFKLWSTGAEVRASPRVAAAVNPCQMCRLTKAVVDRASITTTTTSTTTTTTIGGQRRKGRVGDPGRSIIPRSGFSRRRTPIGRVVGLEGAGASSSPCRRSQSDCPSESVGLRRWGASRPVHYFSAFELLLSFASERMSQETDKPDYSILNRRYASGPHGLGLNLINVDPRPLYTYRLTFLFTNVLPFFCAYCTSLNFLPSINLQMW